MPTTLNFPIFPVELGVMAYGAPIKSGFKATGALAVGRDPDLRVWCWVSLYLFYKRVLLKNVDSIVFDRDLLLPFNPTYVLSNINTP